MHAPVRVELKGVVAGFHVSNCSSPGSNHRSPRADATTNVFDPREASWSAVALNRFSHDRIEPAENGSSLYMVHFSSHSVTGVARVAPCRVSCVLNTPGNGRSQNRTHHHRRVKTPGLQETGLAARRKSDPAKLQIAARLRRETMLSVKHPSLTIPSSTDLPSNRPPDSLSLSHPHCL